MASALETPASTRRQVLPTSVLGMLIFVVAETMFFSGMMSAFTITRANSLATLWPPPGQPRLPASSTALNTGLLLLSGVALLVTHFAWRKAPKKAVGPYLVTLALGAAFLGLQGREWASLLAQGLTLTSSNLGSFFYLIVGAHSLHAVAALLGLAWGLLRLLQGRLTPAYFFGAQTFWYFVVGMWPVIYARLYF
jgi:cytochrome c oxidase subunit 3